jgi:hypothetical protein
MRAQMLDMDSRTYFSSFLYWSNSRFLSETLLARLVGSERFSEIERKLDPDHRTNPWPPSAGTPSATCGSPYR